MINYTDRITDLMRDIVRRVPALADVNLNHVLVFARYGRSGADGAYATCHCLSLPPTDPGYYYWCDRTSGQMTRRSEWFVTKSPCVRLRGRHIHYLVSFALPRFCDQTLSRSRKRRCYPGAEPWVAKLDTIVHELYHIDPLQAGIRRIERRDGRTAATAHSRLFHERVVDMVWEYVESEPDPQVFDFLRYGFDELHERFGPVTATTFRTFPSFPQRYIEALDAQPATPSCCAIEPLRQPQLPTEYTEYDLETRQFLAPALNLRARKGPVADTSLQRHRTTLLAQPLSGVAADPVSRV